jgi:transcriptional regulator with XRE-family HTH domain
MPRAESPAVAKRRLRQRLRRAREAAGLTQHQVAEAVDWSVSKIIRIENGKVAVTTSDLRALLGIFGIDASEIDAWIELARLSRQPTVAAQYADVLPRPFADWLEYEAYASIIRQYETKLIPGVLQTPDYAQSIVEAHLVGRYSEPEISRIVDARLQRAAPLVGSSGPTMSFIIDEAALRRGIGNERTLTSFDVMLEQLTAIKRLNTLGRARNGETVEADLNQHMQIQIVPFEVGSYSMLRGPLELLEFAGTEDPNMVYIEGRLGDHIVLDSDAETATYFDEFAEMEGGLLDPAYTNGMIDDVIESMMQGRNGLSRTRHENRPSADAGS